MTGLWTYHATQNRAIWKLRSEGIFISHSILDEHDGGCIVDHRGQRFCNGILIDGFVDTDNVVVVTSNIYWCVGHCIKKSTSRGLEDG
jgi:hypothetical protein